MSDNNQEQETIPSTEQEEITNAATFSSLFYQVIGLLAYVLLFCIDESLRDELYFAILSTVRFCRIPERRNSIWNDVEHVIDKILSRRDSRVRDRALPPTFAYIRIHDEGGGPNTGPNDGATGQDEDERWKSLLQCIKHAIHRIAKYDFQKCVAEMIGSPRSIETTEFMVDHLCRARENATSVTQMAQPLSMSSETETDHQDHPRLVTIWEQSAEETRTTQPASPASPASPADSLDMTTHEQGDASQAIEYISSEESKHEITHVEMMEGAFLVDDKHMTAENVPAVAATDAQDAAAGITTILGRIDDGTEDQPSPSSFESIIPDESKSSQSMHESKSNGEESSSGSNPEKRDEDDETTILDDVATTPSMEAKKSSSNEQDEESRSIEKTPVDVTDISVYVTNTNNSEDGQFRSEGQPSTVSSLSGGHEFNHPGRWEENASLRNVSRPQGARSKSESASLLGELASNDDNEALLPPRDSQPASSSSDLPPRRPVSSHQQDTTEDTTNTAGSDDGGVVVVPRRHDGDDCCRKCQEACQIL